MGGGVLSGTGVAVGGIPSLLTFANAMAITAAVLTTPTRALAQETPAPSVASPGNAADEEDARNNEESAGNNEVNTLEDIVVSARRVSERAQDVPVAISAFSAATLRARQAVQAIDIARFTPGAQAEQQAAGAFTALITIRGQTQAGVIQSFDPSIGIYQDGIYQGTLTGLAGLGLVDMNRVEILKGPQGTLYGRNTTGGAVSMYTNQPELDELSGEATLGAGNLSSYLARGILNLPLAEDKAAMRLAVAAYTDNGYARDETYDVRLASNTNLFFRGSVKLRPIDDFDAVISGEITRGENGGSPWQHLGLLPNSISAYAIGVESGIIPVDTPAARAAFLTNQPSAGGQVAAVTALYNTTKGGVDGDPYRSRLSIISGETIEIDSASFILTYSPTLSVTIKSLSSYRRLKQHNRGIDFDGGPFAVFDSVLPYKFAVDFVRSKGFNPYGVFWSFKQFTQDLNVSGSLLGNRLSYTGGAFYLHSDQFDQSSNVNNLALGRTSQPSIIPFDSFTRSSAIYGQINYAITPTLKVTGGLRYTWNQKGITSYGQNPLACSVPPPATLANNCEGSYEYNSGNLSYTLSADWKPTPQILLYAKTDRGFRSGGINGRTSASPASVVPFNDEVVYNYEAGLKSDFFGRRLRFNAAAYLQKYDDIQVQILVATGSTFSSAVRNAAKGTIKGFEAELTALPVEGLSLTAGLAHVDPRYDRYTDETGADLRNKDFLQVSRWTWSALGQYTVLVNGNVRLRLVADYSYKSSYNLQPAGGQPDVHVRPGVGIANAQISAIFPGDLEFTAWAKNLFDKRYVSFLQDIAAAGIAAGGYAPPRTYGISATKRF